MAGVVHLDNTPRILSGTNSSTVDFDDVLRTYNGEWHEPTKLRILLDGILIVLLNVVRKIVYGNAVMLNVLHDQLLRFGQLSGGERISLADDWDNVDTGRKALHQLDIEFTEAI